MKIVSVLNQKGGVGKTTTSINLADRLAVTGKRVLLIDGDAQGNSTQALTRSGESFFYDNTLSEVMKGEIEAVEAIYPTVIENVFMLPNDPRYYDTDALLRDRRKRDLILDKKLDSVRELFDYAVIDCPPARSVIIENAVIASDLIIALLDSSMFSLTGAQNLIDDVADIYGGEIEVPLTLVFNKVDGRVKAYKDNDAYIKKALPQYYSGNLNIRVSQSAETASANNMSVRQFAKGGLINNDYQRLANYVKEAFHA